MRRNVLRFFVFIIIINSGRTQDIIRIVNGSFEGEPTRGEIKKHLFIENWIDCGPFNHFHNESPPDIHPNDIWNNNLKPIDGETYLGLVVRDNGTYESVSQHLSNSLIQWKCYSINVYLARAQTYLSLSRQTKKPINYNTPVVLRIYGGTDFCEQKELLVESYEVLSHVWENHYFEFKPEKNYKYITFVAYYHHTPVLPYCGNLMIDGISDIISIKCD